MARERIVARGRRAAAIQQSRARRFHPGPAAVVLAALVFTGSIGPSVVRGQIRPAGLPISYRATYSTHTIPTMAYVGTDHRVAVKVANAGNVTWYRRGPSRVWAGYRWLDASRREVLRGPLIALPGDVVSGGETKLAAAVRAPRRPGDYVLRWDILRPDGVWFSARGSPLLEVSVPNRTDFGAGYPRLVTPESGFTGDTYHVSALLRNTSRMAWPKGREVSAELFWTDAGGAPLHLKRRAIQMPRYVAPGDSVRVAGALVAPRRRGDYLINLELVHRRYGRFSKHGVRALRRRIRVNALTQRVYFHGDRRRKEVALTFDDGANFNLRILETTERYNVPATAFLVGGLIRYIKPEIKRMKADGWEIYGHTWTHAQMTKITDRQLYSEMKRTSDALKKVAGRQLPFVRPPYGSLNSRNVALLNKMGYRVIVWDVDPRDWSNSHTPQEKLKFILRTTRPGSIILLHFGGLGTGDILADVITTLKERGYEFKKLSDILY